MKRPSPLAKAATAVPKRVAAGLALPSLVPADVQPKALLYATPCNRLMKVDEVKNS
jgi:hypothetical protein